MRELLSFLIMPVSILWILLIVSAIFLWLKKKRAIKISLAITSAWIILITTNPLAHLLVSNLETTYFPLDSIPDFKNENAIFIHVLGGGFTDDNDLNALNQLTMNSKGRLTEAIRLYKNCPNCTLIFSGYGGKTNSSTAEVMKNAAISLGITTNKIHCLTDSKNTMEEAFDFTKQFGVVENLILVTDAVHMKRAMFWFNQYGQKPTPAPTNFYIKNNSVRNPWRCLPSSGNISLLNVAIHNHVGLLVARIEKNRLSIK